MKEEVLRSLEKFNVPLYLFTLNILENVLFMNYLNEDIFTDSSHESSARS